MPDLHGWTMTAWPCVCGQHHAPWWRTTPPPSCPHGWPRRPARTPEPVMFQDLVQLLDAVAAQGGTHA